MFSRATKKKLTSDLVGAALGVMLYYRLYDALYALAAYLTWNDLARSLFHAPSLKYIPLFFCAFLLTEFGRYIKSFFK